MGRALPARRVLAGWLRHVGVAVAILATAANTGCVPGPLDETSRRYGYLTMRLDATMPGDQSPDRAQLDRTRTIIEARLTAAGFLGVKVAVDSDRTMIATVLAEQPDQREQQIARLRSLAGPGLVRVRTVLSHEDHQSSGTPSVPAAAATASLISPAPQTGPGATSATGATRPTLDEIIARLGPAYDLARQLPDPKDQPEHSQETLSRLTVFALLSGEEVTLLPAEIQYRVPTISCDQLDQRPVAAAQDEQSVAVACGRPSATAPAEKYLLDSAALGGEDIAKVTVANEASGWGIVLTFTEAGQRKWTELTTVASAGEAPRQVAIVADHTVILAPEIQAVIVGDAELSGAFTKDEADLMAARIGSGVLPITLVVRAVEHSG